MKIKSRLIQDNDCHWYVVPCTLIHKFEDIINRVDSAPEGVLYMESCWVDSLRVDGPHVVEFDWEMP